MNIQLTPKNAKKLKIDLEHKETLENKDTLWIMTYFMVNFPERENYLYLYHPESGVGIIRKMEDDWKDDIEREIWKAFENFFFDLKRFDIDVGSYWDEIEDLRFLPVQDDIKDLSVRVEKRKTLYKQLYRHTMPEEKKFFVSDVKLKMKNEVANTIDGYGLGTTPLKEFENMLTRFSQETEPEAFSFEDNREALTVPKLDRFIVERSSVFDDEDEERDDIPVLSVDTTAILIKEPIAKNKKLLDKAMSEFQDLLDREPNPRDPQSETLEELDNLREKMSDLVWVSQSPYTGAYKDLIVPKELPEEMVFEFVVTLYLGPYTALRKVAVPADMSFVDFDYLLTRLFRWVGFPYHLSGFFFPNPETPENTEVEEVVGYIEEDFPEDLRDQPTDYGMSQNINPFYRAVEKPIKNYKLKDYFPEHKTAQYRYDYGDNYLHAVELVGIKDKKDYEELPYLIDSVGVAPAEDSGGVFAFFDFIDDNLDTFDRETYLRYANDWIEQQDYYLKSPSSLAPLFDDRESE